MKKSFKYLPLIEAVISSQKIVLKYFKNDDNFQLKSDDSPLTQADLELNQHLVSAIKKEYPKSAIISEENSPESNVKAILQDEVFIIDPLDGTSSFIKGSPEFSVNIALKIKNKLVMGIIYSPIEDVLYYAENEQLFKVENASQKHQKISRIIPQKNFDKNEITVIATRREDELKQIKQDLSKLAYKLNFVSFSSSLKFCYLSEGMADLYYRAAKISIWDVAAGFAIARAAGFEIIDHQKNDFLEKILNKNYAKTLQENNFRIDPFIVKRPAIKL